MGYGLTIRNEDGMSGDSIPKRVKSGAYWLHEMGDDSTLPGKE